MHYCRFLNRRSPNELRPGAGKRMETVFRPFICADPRRDPAWPEELGNSLAAAQKECRRRCPARFGLPPEERPKEEGRPSGEGQRS